MDEFIGYRNGVWVPVSEILPVPGDRGPSMGDQVTEMVRTFDGKSFRMRDHIDRLYKSLKYTRIDPGLTADELYEVSEEGIRRNEHLRPAGGDISLSHVVSRGAGGPRAWGAGPPNVFIRYSPMSYGMFGDKYETGINAAIPRTRSFDPASLDPKIKHLSRMNMSIAELEANDIDAGAWPILLDSNGHLTEGSGYNVFIATDGVLRTPTDHAALVGISRMMALDLAEQLQIPATEENLEPYDLFTADECFFSSTPFSLLPVTRVDGREIGDGKPGPMTQQLLAAWSESVGIDIVGQAAAAAQATS